MKSKKKEVDVFEYHKKRIARQRAKEVVFYDANGKSFQFL